LFDSSGNASHSKSEGIGKMIPKENKFRRAIKTSPSEIVQRKFKKSFRGYNRGEVEKFLNKIAEGYRKLLEENETLSEEIRRLKDELEGYNSKKRELEKTLSAIQRGFQRMEENSEDKAQLIIEKAELTARKIVEESQKKLSKLREETARLNSQKILLLTKLRSMIETHAELLNFYEKNLDEGNLEKGKEKASSKKTKTPLPHRPSRTTRKGIVLEE